MHAGPHDGEPAPAPAAGGTGKLHAHMHLHQHPFAEAAPAHTHGPGAAHAPGGGGGHTHAPPSADDGSVHLHLHRYGHPDGECCPECCGEAGVPGHAHADRHVHLHLYPLITEHGAVRPPAPQKPGTPPPDTPAGGGHPHGPDAGCDGVVTINGHRFDLAAEPLVVGWNGFQAVLTHRCDDEEEEVPPSGEEMEELEHRGYRLRIPVGAQERRASGTLYINGKPLDFRYDPVTSLFRSDSLRAGYPKILALVDAFVTGNPHLVDAVFHRHGGH